MNHLNFKCSSNDSSCPCIKCIKNEKVGGKCLSEVQVFHLTAKLLNIQVFTVKGTLAQPPLSLEVDF